MRKSIFQAGRRYTFSDYFEMGQPTEEILAEFGYSFSLASLDLPLATEIDNLAIENLRAAYYALIPKVSLNSEIAKRELLVAPVLHNIVRNLDAKLHVEYAIDVDNKLSGSIDYLLRAAHELIVIEAKKGDLERGFNQLAVEMIALAKYEADDTPELLYGAITIGEVWRFAVLDKAAKSLAKDVHTYRFPEDLANIFAILNGILA